MDPPDPQAVGTLRGVDWCNRGYGDTLPVFMECRGTGEERHRAGEGIHSLREYHLVGVTYGDLTGDGREDALVVIEGVSRSVLIDARPPIPVGTILLFELRGADLYVYPGVPTGDEPILRASITNGIATLVRRRSTRECVEHWRLVGEELQSVGPPCR